MISGLNPQQQAAVTSGNQHALILAGAGSGKTRVLTTRMAWLIQHENVSPYELIAVTFTNKAAREMLTRLVAHTALNTRGMWVGTFHGLCNRLLRTHFKEAGLAQTFQILDSADQLSAIRRILKTHGIDDTNFPPRDVQKFINSAKEDGLRPDSVDTYNTRSKQLQEIYGLYQQQCDREGVADFAELLLRSVELLERNKTILEHYQQRFKHILVDEFQDTNNLQYRWLKLLAGGGACIFAVGDDDQSIYAFRGANVQNMAHFEHSYAGENVIRLEQNYRSSGHILDAANALIANNADRLGKNLWTDQGAGEAIKVIEQPSDALEAQWVIDEITSLVNKGCAHNDIAILYRSNAQSRVIEHALFSAGMPYKVYGGLRFFERQEVKHALAYLRLMDNPHDDTAWLRVVNFPTRGIGARSQEQLAELAQNNNSSLYSAVAYMTGRAGTNLVRFVHLIESLAYDAQSMPLPELIKKLITDTGLIAYYQADRDGADRLENLHELVSAAAAFVLQENWEDEPAGRIIDNQLIPLSPLGAFLSHASLEAGDNQAQSGDNAVQLMTIHSAKGLEFNNVFITGLEEGLFPHENSMYEPDGLEEERRLMYVALTRAKQKLYLTLAQSRMLHGKTRYSMRSSFLKEIPEQHLDWLTAQDQRIAAPDSPAWSGAFRRGGSSFQGSGNTTQPLSARSTTSAVIVNNQSFRIGQGVSHSKFGEGTILSLSGSGLDAQAQIHFKDAGTKTLALGVAKLNIIAG